MQRTIRSKTNLLFSLAILFCALLSIGHIPVAQAADPVAARKSLHEMGITYNEQEFATKAGAGDMAAVTLFLDGGMDVNAGAGAALGLAAGRGQIDMVRFLLAKGAKPTANALQFARTRGHKEIEKILIDAGAKE